MTRGMALGLPRRQFLKRGCGCALGIGIAASGGLAARAASHGPGRCGLTPDEALQALKDGNAAYRAELSACTAQGQARRIEIAAGQAPFCVLVSCSDSRVAAEIVFGRGLGEMFIVRNASNTIDTTALGSIEYAVEHLGTPLIVVMGHSRCGAVEAAVSLVDSNAVFPEAIEHMLGPIVPAVLAVREKPGDRVDNAVRANVDRTVARLRLGAEPIIAGPLKAGALRVVGASYSLDTGAVDFFNVG